MSKKPTRQATLCFLTNNNKVLLAMKKRGFGKGLWNGTGGKFEPQIDRNVRHTAVRETQEEICVRPRYLKQSAVFRFRHIERDGRERWGQDVHVFIGSKWSGIPKETEEMKPKWFEFSKIPYKQMWEDDRIWLPRVLLGERLEGWFNFDSSNKIIKYEINRA